MEKKDTHKSCDQLTDIVDRLAKSDLDSDGVIEVQEILAVFGERAFGPLFMVLALLQLLPTGLIPVVTDLVAILTFLFSWQLLVGSKHPWIPEKILKIRFDAQKVFSAVAKARPFIARISGWFKPRANFLIEPRIASEFLAVYGMILAVLIFLLGFIPGAADPAALALLVLGIGLVAMDGWAILASYLFTVTILTVVFLFAGRLFS